MNKRKIGPFEVAEIGLGCMNVSHGYAPTVSDKQARRLIHQAIDHGVTFLDTAALYGFGANERLLNDVLRTRRHEVVLCSKGGLVGERVDGKMQRMLNGRPDALRQHLEGSLRRLGTETIDLYYLHRWDKRVPIEDSIGAMADFVRAGKVIALGLSEVGANTLRLANAVHPIAAVQSEYSLWTRNPEIAVLNACAELGVSLVAFSPLARAYLSATLERVDNLAKEDLRRAMPRFSLNNYPANFELLKPFTELAQSLACTPVQLALAWLLAKAPHIIPIPGTTSEAHLRENLAAVKIRLSAEQFALVDSVIDPKRVLGERYPSQALIEIDSECFTNRSQ